jgi:hypothetical protein
LLSASQTLGLAACLYPFWTQKIPNPSSLNHLFLMSLCEEIIVEQNSTCINANAKNKGKCRCSVHKEFGASGNRKK